MFLIRKWLATCSLVFCYERTSFLTGWQSGLTEELGVSEVQRCMPYNDWLFLKCKAVPIIDDTYFLTNIAKVFYTPIGMTEDQLSCAMKFDFLRLTRDLIYPF